MIFLLFNVLLFVASASLICLGFASFSVFLELPIGLEILIAIGFVTPVMNLYDTIRNFIGILIKTQQTVEEEDED
jgi:hypothetical protein